MDGWQRLRADNARLKKLLITMVKNVDKSMMWGAGIALFFLVAFGVAMVVMLLRKPMAEKQALKPKIVATKPLAAYHLIAPGDLVESLDGNLEESKDEAKKSGSQESPKTFEGLTGRYLLVGVKKGAEVTSDMVAHETANKVLPDAASIAIPATSTSTFGGKLKAGEMLTVTAVPEKPSEPKQEPPSFTCLVLSVPAGGASEAGKQAGDAGAIILAINQEERDRFVQASAGARLLVTRKLSK